jgi:hypothetical protein
MRPPIFYGWLIVAAPLPGSGSDVVVVLGPINLLLRRRPEYIGLLGDAMLSARPRRRTNQFGRNSD